MKIRSLYIDGYKNLIQTQVDFDPSYVPIAVIGNNGTGKSNLIEALIHIFISLYYDYDLPFSYRINYECNGKLVEIEKILQDQLRIVVNEYPITRSRFKYWVRETGRMQPFPDLIFCYYSGTCDRTRLLIERYNRSYNLLLRNQTRELDRLFVFSELVQAEWSLLGLFAHRHFELLGRLSLGDIQTFRITLIPPRTYSIETDDPSFWGTRGAIREFLADLDNASAGSYAPDTSPETGVRTYLFKREGLGKIGSALERRGSNFQSMMQGLAARKMVKETVFELVNSQTGATYGIDDLSEGEKQLLSVIGGLKLYNQPESLVLLDEPDTHLNPTWSWEYESLLQYALSKEQMQQSTVLVATHDPVLISGLSKEQVLIANLDGANLNYIRPIRDPRGQGVANVLTSEFFGLPSSLDKNTQNLLDERLKLAYKTEALNDDERERLKKINDELEILGMTISFRDPDYKKYEEDKYTN